MASGRLASSKQSRPTSNTRGSVNINARRLMKSLNGAIALQETSAKSLADGSRPVTAGQANAIHRVLVGVPGAADYSREVQV